MMAESMFLTFALVGISAGTKILTDKNTSNECECIRCYNPLIVLWFYRSGVSAPIGKSAPIIYIIGSYLSERVRTKQRTI